MGQNSCTSFGRVIATLFYGMTYLPQPPFKLFINFILFGAICRPIRAQNSKYHRIINLRSNRNIIRQRCVFSVTRI